jgi:5-methylcytosine-specific restriction endonuclease McrA
VGPNRYQRLRAEVLLTKPPVCAWCGREIDLALSGKDPLGPTIDHILPRSKGGTNRPDHLQPMHRQCNERRGNRPLLQRNSRDW